MIVYRRSKMWSNTILSVVFCAQIYYVSSQIPYEDGDRCQLGSGKRGVCKPFKSCEKKIFKEQSEPYINYCSRVSVCCPLRLNRETTPSKPTRHPNNKNKNASEINQNAPEQKRSKSYQKCKEYSEFRCRPRTLPTIHNGELVNSPEEFPHMALLTFGDNEDIQCGGSLISDQYILTAGHCTSLGRSGDETPVDAAYLGFLSKNNLNEFGTLQKFNIVDICTPDYHPLRKYHDIALLRLDRPVTMTNNVIPACLHEEYDIKTSILIATGWGVTEHSSLSDDLLKVTLKMESIEKCQSLYQPNRKLLQGIQDDGQFCAGKDDKDTCLGDSGGPLQIHRTDFICMQDIIGVTSLGLGCGNYIPSVYTRVSNYIPWIESIVWP